MRIRELVTHLMLRLGSDFELGLVLELGLGLRLRLE